jgi:hypothetical protein
VRKTSRRYAPGRRRDDAGDAGAGHHLPVRRLCSLRPRAVWQGSRGRLRHHLVRRCTLNSVDPHLLKATGFHKTLPLNINPGFKMCRFKFNLRHSNLGHASEGAGAHRRRTSVGSLRVREAMVLHNPSCLRAPEGRVKKITKKCITYFFILLPPSSRLLDDFSVLKPRARRITFDDFI